MSDKESKPKLSKEMTDSIETVENARQTKRAEAVARYKERNKERIREREKARRNTINETLRRLREDPTYEPPEEYHGSKYHSWQELLEARRAAVRKCYLRSKEKKLAVKQAKVFAEYGFIPYERNTKMLTREDLIELLKKAKVPKDLLENASQDPDKLAITVEEITAE